MNSKFVSLTASLILMAIVFGTATSAFGAGLL